MNTIPLTKIKDRWGRLSERERLIRLQGLWDQFVNYAEPSSGYIYAVAARALLK